MSALQLKPALAAPLAISSGVVSPCRPVSALSPARQDALPTVPARAANAAKSVSIAAAMRVVFDVVIWPLDIWPLDIWPLDIWPLDIWPLDFRIFQHACPKWLVADQVASRQKSRRPGPDIRASSEAQSELPSIRDVASLGSGGGLRLGCASSCAAASRSRSTLPRAPRSRSRSRS